MVSFVSRIRILPIKRSVLGVKDGCVRGFITDVAFPYAVVFVYGPDSHLKN